MIDVILPVHNEAEALPWVLHRMPPGFEPLVVDNASEDRTFEVLEPLADGDRVRVLRNDRNRGKGYSVRRGMLEARGALRLHCDADCAQSFFQTSMPV